MPILVTLKKPPIFLQNFKKIAIFPLKIAKISRTVALINSHRHFIFSYFFFILNRYKTGAVSVGF
ncbi:hypothetical protein WDU94_011979 [Cyamophila willieti]